MILAVIEGSKGLYSACIATACKKSDSSSNCRSKAMYFCSSEETLGDPSNEIYAFFFMVFHVALLTIPMNKILNSLVASLDRQPS